MADDATAAVLAAQEIDTVTSQTEVNELTQATSNDLDTNLNSHTTTQTTDLIGSSFSYETGHHATNMGADILQFALLENPDPSQELNKDTLVYKHIVGAAYTESIESLCTEADTTFRATTNQDYAHIGTGLEYSEQKELENIFQIQELRESGVELVKDDVNAFEFYTDLLNKVNAGRSQELVNTITDITQKEMCDVYDGLPSTSLYVGLEEIVEDKTKQVGKLLTSEFMVKA